MPLTIVNSRPYRRVPVSAPTVEPLFFDGFDYTVNRDDSNEPTVWSSRGWGPSVKAMNVTNQNGGRGWIYTTAASPTGAGRSLVLESRPDLAPSFDGEHQTDYYLTYGNAALGDLSTIPGDVWLRYWTYCTPGSRWFGESKHIYPTFATSHQTNTLHWMILQGSRGFAQVGGYPELTNGARRMCLQTSDAVNPGADVGAGLAQWKLFQNLDQSGFLAGTWYQVKHHINTSGAQGSWEMWRRAYGASEWTKLAEWIGGVTMVPHWQTGVPTLFNWIIGSSSGATPSGHTAFKMPTVVVCPVGDVFSSYEYIDDFGIYASDPG